MVHRTNGAKGSGCRDRGAFPGRVLLAAGGEGCQLPPALQPAAEASSFKSWSGGRQMKLVECPHCFTRVVAKPDGRCRVCKLDTEDVRGTDPSRTSIRIVQGADLPPVCCQCGESTRRWVRICSKRPGRHELPGLAQAAILGCLSLGIGVSVIPRHLLGADCVELSLIQCARCGRLGKPLPKYVDFPNARMTFVVHKKFRESVETPD